MGNNLLLVDDSPLIRRVVELTFEDHDVTIYAASDPDEALACARRLRPDIVVASAEMKGAGGLELCRKFRSEADLSDVPVLMLSSSRDVPSEGEVLEAGAVGLLTKPFEPEKLLAVVDQALATSGARVSPPAEETVPSEEEEEAPGGESIASAFLAPEAEPLEFAETGPPEEAHGPLADLPEKAAGGETPPPDDIEEASGFGAEQEAEEDFSSGVFEEESPYHEAGSALDPFTRGPSPEEPEAAPIEGEEDSSAEEFLAALGENPREPARFETVGEDNPEDISEFFQEEPQETPADIQFEPEQEETEGASWFTEPEHPGLIDLEATEPEEEPTERAAGEGGEEEFLLPEETAEDAGFLEDLEAAAESAPSEEIREDAPIRGWDSEVRLTDRLSALPQEEDEDTLDEELSEAQMAAPGPPPADEMEEAFPGMGLSEEDAEVFEAPRPADVAEGPPDVAMFSEGAGAAGDVDLSVEWEEDAEEEAAETAPPASARSLDLDEFFPEETEAEPFAEEASFQAGLGEGEEETSGRADDIDAEPFEPAGEFVAGLASSAGETGVEPGGAETGPEAPQGLGFAEDAPLEEESSSPAEETPAFSAPPPTEPQAAAASGAPAAEEPKAPPAVANGEGIPDQIDETAFRSLVTKALEDTIEGMVPPLLRHMESVIVGMMPDLVEKIVLREIEKIKRGE